MTFSELRLPEPLLKAVTDLGYTAPTQIQMQSIPLLMQGKDVIGQSQTGSGKTAAFGIPMLCKLSPNRGLQGLILTPTRELCLQVSDALRGFSKYMPFKIVAVFGGVGIGPQINASRSADVIVATPGRLLDLMNRGLKLGGVKYLVLDEADRMLDMGFIDDVERIIQQIPKQRQTVLFSATLSPRLQTLVKKHMNMPSTIQTKLQVDKTLLVERAYQVEPNDKLSLLVHLIKSETAGIAVVFCKTRHGCDKVAKRLKSQKIDAIAIHGGLAQNQRTRAIDTLHAQGEGVLVATDVASRGLHIDNISHVYNYDIPQTPDDYVHRIGRTARAGAKGDAVTFVSSQDVRDFREILRTVKREVPFTILPKFEKIIIPYTPNDRPFHKPAQGSNARRPFWKNKRRN
ncbi:MAG: DEAD/DEAH box helicase [Nanoarchaeota archaeon]